METKSKCRLLECLLVIVGIIFFLTVRLQQKCINLWKAAAAKNKAIYTLMNQWTYIKQEGKELSVYFNKKNYKKIAIYGMGDVGLRLVKELEHSGIEILYGIDRNAQSIYSDIKLVTLDDELVVTDAIVVTVVGGFDEVYAVLSQKVGCPIIAIEDILNEI